MDYYNVTIKNNDAQWAKPEGTYQNEKSFIVNFIVTYPNKLFSFYCNFLISTTQNGGSCDQGVILTNDYSNNKIKVWINGFSSYIFSSFKWLFWVSIGH